MFYHNYSNHHHYSDKEQKYFHFAVSILLCQGEILAMFLSEGGSGPIWLPSAKERLDSVILGSVPQSFFI